MKKIITVFFISFLLITSNANSQWAANACGLPYDSKFPALLVKDSTWLAATDFGVFFSIHENEHFINATPSLTDRVINTIAILGNLVYAGTSGGNVYCAGILYPHYINTTNNLPPNSIIHSLAVTDNKIFAGIKDRYVYISADSGKSWTSASNGLPIAIDYKIYLFTNGSNVYAATDGAGIYVTKNYGSSWETINNGLCNLNIRSVGFLNSYIFAGTHGGGIYVSSNNGEQWQTCNNGLTNLNVNAFFSINNRIVAGTDMGVFISTNYGASWFERNEGWNKPKVLSFALGDFLHAGTEADMVWVRPLDEIVSVNTISSNIPYKFKLFQNYPNPFNPNTIIRFQINPSVRTRFTSLKIYNELGKEIEVLVNENLNAGEYEYNFNASGFPSGIYFYKLESDDFKETKRMILIK